MQRKIMTQIQKKKCKEIKSTDTKDKTFLNVKKQKKNLNLDEWVEEKLLPIYFYTKSNKYVLFNKVFVIN